MSDQPAQARRLSRPRFAVMIFAAVYPLVTALLYFLMPLTVGWDLWARTLLLCPMIVVCMVWGIIPFIQQRLGRFITVPV
ncbi:MAG: hypothetical protein HWE23_01720 [Rhodobacteraceae bacterium]|nr:hypothetical protein [Paracoccaceae bacterium]